MQKTKPQKWTRGDGQQFVMVPLKDFNRLEELAEDRWLSDLMRESHERNKGKRGVPLKEAIRQLGLSKSLSKQKPRKLSSV